MSRASRRYTPTELLRRAEQYERQGDAFRARRCRERAADVRKKERAKDWKTVLSVSSKAADRIDYAEALARARIKDRCASSISSQVREALS
jgi:hypothetical protein